MKTSILFTLFYLLLYSCTAQNNVSYFTIVDDVFTNNPLIYDLSEPSFSNVKVKVCRVELYNNIHDNRYVDTVRTFCFKRSEFKTIRNTRTELLFHAIVKDNDIHIVRNISIGMTFKEFVLIFNKNFLLSTTRAEVTIKNEEETASHLFIFNNGVLDEIEIFKYNAN